MSKCKGKHCHLWQRRRERQVHSLALPLLQRPKIPRGGLLSLRWRLCLSQFGVLLLEDFGRERLEADGDKDSLFSNAELAVSAISSILRDFDLKRSDALPVEETLALSLQGVTSVSSRVFIYLPLSWF